MTERRVWICQCLCPSRHCILAMSGEADDEAAAERIKHALRRTVVESLQDGGINPWCALCGAQRATWRYELRRTAFATAEEAKPHLERLEAENLAVNAVFGDLQHKQRPN